MYSVGDIVWVVNSSIRGVKPYQVVEETTHKTLSGTKKTFYVKAPSAKAIPQAVDDLGGEIFTSVQQVQDELNKRASLAIERMIDEGKGMITKHFKPKPSLAILEEPSVSETVVDDFGEEDFIILSDGSKAKINIKGVM